MKFKFIGLDGGLTATSNATPTLTAWKTPVVVTNANDGDITLGCTYASGTISGGTAYNSKGLALDVNANVVFTPLLGSETVDLVDRAMTGSASLDLTAANQVTFKTAVDANTTISLGFIHGTAAGNIVTFYAPVVQRINPKVEDLNGYMMCAYDLRLMPSSGNDELRISVA
jgi:hypothetical protein